MASCNREIYKNKSLPQSDPFSYTSHDTPSTRKAVILKGNWLTEVIFYKVYTLWDLKGTIILRDVLLLLFLFFVFLNIKKQGSSDLIALILIAAGVFILSKGFAGERPQLFTFLVFSLVFYLLEDFRINHSKKVFFIPVLVMLLSNMHPGYIVRILLISIYLVGDGIGYFIKRNSNSFKTLLIIWILTLSFSIFNPNGLSSLITIFSIGEHTKGVVEFMPTFSLYAKKITPLHYSYIVFLLFSLVSIRYVKKIGLVHILLLIVFSIMSFVSIRFLIFYMCISAPILARIILNLKEEKIFEKFYGILKRKEGVLYLISCIIGTYLVFNVIPALAKYEFKEDTLFAVPKDSADFLSNLKIDGNMFNEYGFGGYLIWRLYPDKKVFIDGRALEPDIMSKYNVVASAEEGVQKSWEDIIKEYNISYIVMPPLLPHGEIYPIVEKLLEKEDWVLIYNDHLSLIFLRKGSGNEALIKRFAKDKKEGLNTIIIQAAAMAKKNRANPYYLIALGKAFFKTGKIEDAQKAFLMAFERDPNNLVIKEWLQKLRESQ